MTTAKQIDAEQIYAIERPSSKLLTLFILRNLLLLCLGPWFIVAFIPWYFKYHTLKYRFDDEGVSMSWGILWRREIHLTYARIQDIHLSRGLLERWLGLATIQLQTASGSAAAEMSIIGLTEYDVLRDFLYSRMRGAQDIDGEQKGDEGDGDVTAGLLTDIRDELRGIREALAARPS